MLDDHEVENNYSDNLPPPQPLQRYAGYRAASEWIPRVVNKRDRFRIFRRVPLNANAELFLIDTRQYRQGSADGLPRQHPRADAQMAWLLAALKSSTARWKIIVQQMPVAADPTGSGARTDGWDGFPEDRALLLGEIERNGIPNVVFLTGDAHVFACNTLASDFDAARGGQRAPLGGRVRRRIGHVARPRQARERRPRGVALGAASTTAASTATRSSPWTRRTS